VNRIGRPGKCSSSAMHVTTTNHQGTQPAVPVGSAIKHKDDQRLRWSLAWWSPRRNRTGDPILTMEPPGTAVRTAVSPGHARPYVPKLSVLLRPSYALTFKPCAGRMAGVIAAPVEAPVYHRWMRRRAMPGHQGVGELLIGEASQPAQCTRRDTPATGACSFGDRGHALNLHTMFGRRAAYT